jgi:hypothetical protein
MNQKNVKICYIKLDKQDRVMKKTWKKHEKNMKKNEKTYFFKLQKISNPPNQKKKYRNKNINLQNHIGIIHLYNSFKPKPFGTSGCSLDF